MPADTFRCADSADDRKEPLYGTASYVKSWLLLEQPGSWGRDALRQSRLPEPVARELRRRTREAGIRMVLIRRGAGLATTERQCYFARADARNPHLSRMSLGRAEDLLDVDLSPISMGGEVDGATECSKPLFLVCTHGRHDACCSIRGNQVSRVACATPGADAWESSHIGGDRFAANLVCFPHGIYYGRVGPDDVSMLMDAYDLGRLSLDHLRGRCGHTFVVQAADYFVRRESGVTDIDGVSLVDTTKRGRQNLIATFAVAGRGHAQVEVRVDETAERYRLTCTANASEPIPRYELVSCVFHD